MSKKPYNLYSQDEFSSEHSGVVAGKEAINKLTGWSPSTATTLPIWPAFCGRSYWYEGNWFKHFNYYKTSLELIIEGSMCFEQKGETHTVNPGEIYIIHHGVDSLLETGPTGYCEKYALGLHGTAMEVIMNLLGLSEILTMKLPNPEYLISKFRKIEELLKQQELSTISEISALTYNILVDLSILHPNPLLPLPVKNAVTILESNLDKQLSMTKVAKSVGISIATLNRLFKKHFNQTTKQYLTSLKLNTATHLLKHTKLSIKEIAQQLGYQNQLYFSNDFKKRMLKSPSEYRNITTIKLNHF